MSNIKDVDSIDQILAKIKKAINDDAEKINSQNSEKLPQDTSKDSEVLELTHIVSKAQSSICAQIADTIDAKNTDVMSKHVRDFKQKLPLLMKDNNIISEKEVKEIFKETLRPYLKSWLNNNLKGIAEEVCAAELRKIFKKII